MTGHAVAMIWGSIRQTEAHVAAALNALDDGQTEDVRAELRGALMSLNDLAETLGRK